MSDLNTERVVIPRARLRPMAAPPSPAVDAKRAEVFEGFCTQEEVQAIFNVGWRCIYMWCEQGMPFQKVGRRRIYNLQELRAWMLKHPLIFGAT